MDFASGEPFQASHPPLAQQAGPSDHAGGMVHHLLCMQGGEEDAVARLALQPVAVQRQVLKALTRPQKRELDERWERWAHEGQRAPDGDWRVWLILAGRGFGKTRAGAEWVSALARANPALRIALVGRTNEEVKKVMIEGESGLFAVARTGEAFRWASTAGVLEFESGALAFVYSSENPEKLRGPQHHVAWCDELAKWAYPDATWDNLMLGLRLGERQRAAVTTTPRAIPLLKRILADGDIAVSRGGTADNPNLSDQFLAAMQRAYGGTRLGRQELEGELIEDVEGALWTRGLIEASRIGLPLSLTLSPPCGERGEFRRVVIGVDPPASAAGTCGIVACALGDDGIAYVLGDHSVQGRSPEGWARAVAGAYDRHSADRVVIERNMGGDMVESVLRSVALDLPVTGVHASRGKAARAEPVAGLFENGRAKLAGTFPELEDELAGLTAGGGYEGPGKSPDRADAMVWALTELMLKPQRAEPRIRVL